jgi:DNA-binding GntR family transcriptional regulator
MGQSLKRSILLSHAALQRQPSVTDIVYNTLYDSIVRLDMPPGTKLSEADVAGQLDVSRQPVRDAFYRLGQQGFLLIRPQRATVVAKISVAAVLRARFIRTALETEILAAALPRLSDENIADLGRNMEAQSRACKANDRETFQTLDDEFHAKICNIAGHPEVWDLIKDTKAHMDRVRYLTLDKGKGAALRDHNDILDAMRAGSLPKATALMREHISRVGPFMDKIRPEHIDYFEENDRDN